MPKKISNKLTPEEEAVAAEVRYFDEIDPRFRERVRGHLAKARHELKLEGEKDSKLEKSPAEIEELDNKIRLYGKIQDVIVKMDIMEAHDDLPFGEANARAQYLEEKGESSEPIVYEPAKVTHFKKEK